MDLLDWGMGPKDSSLPIRIHGPQTMLWNEHLSENLLTAISLSPQSSGVSLILTVCSFWRPSLVEMQSWFLEEHLEWPFCQLSESSCFPIPFLQFCPESVGRKRKENRGAFPSHPSWWEPCSCASRGQLSLSAIWAFFYFWKGAFLSLYLMFAHEMSFRTALPKCCGVGKQWLTLMQMKEKWRHKPLSLHLLEMGEGPQSVHRRSSEEILLVQDFQTWHNIVTSLQRGGGCLDEL